MKDKEDKEGKSPEKNLEDAAEVSAVYQALRHEKPSAELDAEILRAARQDVEKQLTRKRIPYQAYSIAASICLAVLAVSLFLNNDEELTRGELDAASIPLSDAPASAFQQTEEAALQEEDADALQEESLQLELQASRVAIPPQNPLQEVPELNQNADVSAASALSIEADASGAQVPLAESVQSSTADVPIDYRASADTWLAEIQRLTVTGNQVQLEQERMLFAEAYPDIDIDAALAGLETDN